MIGASVRRTSGWRGLVSFLLLVPVLLAACSDQGGKKKSPSFGAGITGVSTSGNNQVIITLNPNSINKGGTVGITVTMQTLNGAPIADRRVNLSTTGGTLSSVFGLTDAGGKFVSSLRVPRDYAGANPITISATIDGVTAEAQVLINDLGTLAIVPPGPVTLAPGDKQTFNCVGGVPPYRWEPSGGSLNTSTGAAVVFTAGSSAGTFFLKCADSAGNSASVSITISLGVGELAISPLSATLRPGENQTFQAAGGRPPYSWSFSSSAGTLSATTGSSTTITAGNVDGTFTLTLRDSNGATKTANVTIRVEDLVLSPGGVDRTIQAEGDEPPGTCPATKTKFTVNFIIGGGTGPYTATSALFGAIPVSGNGFTYTFNLGMGGGDDVTDVVTLRDSRGKIATATITVTCTAVAPSEESSSTSSLRRGQGKRR
jgi:hypothetical protein